MSHIIRISYIFLKINDRKYGERNFLKSLTKKFNLYHKYNCTNILKGPKKDLKPILKGPKRSKRRRQ